MGTTVKARESDALFSKILADRLINTRFQSIVELESGTVVAYEALSRGPVDTEFHNPTALFERAHELDRVTDLDLSCWLSSVRTATEQGFTTAHTLFVNVEPGSLRRSDLADTPHPPAAAVLEVTERALMNDPSGLLYAIDRARALGYRIAIDDLGADPASLALLPLLAPDLIKLDMALIRERPGQDAARVMSAVAAHAERTGAVVLAEGVETEKHRVTARALGATYGQGWLFGRPVAEVPNAAALTGITFPADPAVTVSPSGTPYEVVAPMRTPRLSNRALLVEMSIFLESRALASGNSAVVLSTFQHQRNLTPDTRRRYRALAETAGLVAVYMAGDAEIERDSRIRVAQIGPTDPLLDEWDIVVLTADFAAVLAAREVNPSNHAEGSYEFVLTHDRDLATAAALTLINRLPT
ncbi:EAL domain-containing protein [Cryobacterium sp. GrIS_2_6]|uniref:sensor domain-containing phosphodiesterase n=1 Tax=Cryobacterium sp. GrIS_2_6 TaxID=3162785 RepID=UPI002DFF9692|nr:EAL domain-containing protein (putative c-di-GMP-specific phosphodiesterase class I) [Cryobacterium psychrotolerans]